MILLFVVGWLAIETERVVSMHRIVDEACPKCRYPLHGLTQSGVCPECGAKYGDRCEETFKHRLRGKRFWYNALVLGAAALVSPWILYSGVAVRYFVHYSWLDSYWFAARNVQFRFISDHVNGVVAFLTIAFLCMHRARLRYWAGFVAVTLVIFGCLFVPDIYRNSPRYFGYARQSMDAGSLALACPCVFIALAFLGRLGAAASSTGGAMNERPPAP